MYMSSFPDIFLIVATLGLMFTPTTHDEHFSNIALNFRLVLIRSIATGESIVETRETPTPPEPFQFLTLAPVRHLKEEDSDFNAVTYARGFLFLRTQHCEPEKPTIQPKAVVQDPAHDYYMENIGEKTEAAYYSSRKEIRGLTIGNLLDEPWLRLYDLDDTVLWAASSGYKFETGQLQPHEVSHFLEIRGSIS